MIHIETDGDVRILRLDHKKASAFDLELCLALEDAAHDIESTRHAKAVVLTGTGSIFSAGVDLFRVLDGGPDYVAEFLPALSRSLQVFFELGKPLVAAVNGHAIAGGCLLALTADLRFMARGKGRMGTPELLVGVPFPSIALEIIRFVVPARHRQRMIYGGATVGVDDCLATGLVDEICEEKDLLPTAIARAHALAAIPAHSLGLTKRELRAPSLEGWRTRAEMVDREVQSIWSSPETADCIRGYLEKTLGKSDRK